jgi:Domain of unknown function (DUF4345)
VRELLVIPCAGYFAWLGVNGLRRPRTLLRIFGIEVSSADGAAEIRAVYGGFPVVTAGALLASLVWRELDVAVAVAVAAAMVGMVLGRLASYVVDRSLSKAAVVFLVIDVVVALALVGAALLSAWP